MKTFACVFCFAATAYGGVGFQLVTAADPPGVPLAIGIWYPSSAAASPQPLELFVQNVAKDGAISGRALPLVVISHGTQGSLASHFDTAGALAAAGFIVAAVTHTGDNAQDQSYVGNRRDLTDRPRQMRRVVDYLLKEWPGRDRIDRNRIGMFGFSLGGFTALVAIGGTPDLAAIPRFCAANASAPECQFIQQSHGDQLSPMSGAAAAWKRDERIRAAVIAAPAVAFVFANGGLGGVRIPVQLWRAGEDQQAPDTWNSKIVREGLALPPEEHVVAGAGHMSFRLCSDALAKVAGWMCQDTAGFDRSAFHNEFNRAVVAFLSKQLR